MTANQLFESEYYFVIGLIFALLYIVFHFYLNRDDDDIVLDFLCVVFCFMLVIAWPLVLVVLCVGVPIFGTIFLLGWILNKIRTR